MLPLGSAAFLLFGVVLVVLGACHDGLVASLGLDHTAFGWLGASLSIGIGVGVLGAGPLVDRYPRRPTFVVSTLIVAAALGGVDGGMSFARALGHVTVMGVGVGMFDTLLNTITVERWEERSMRPMAWLHAMVPVGGIATPWLISQAGGASEWVDLFRAIGVAFLLLAIWVACVSLPAPVSRKQRTWPGEPRDTGIFLRPAFLALCFVGLAYVGIEAALTLFAVPYATGGLGLSEAHGQRAISALWLGILLGRFLLMIPRRKIDARLLVASGTAGALFIAFGAWLELPHIELMMGACGLTLSCVFPLMIALTGQLVPEAPGKAIGLVAALGSVGGFALPPITGAIADATHIGVAIGSLAAWSGLIAAAGWVAYRRT